MNGPTPPPPPPPPVATEPLRMCCLHPAGKISATRIVDGAQNILVTEEEREGELSVAGLTFPFDLYPITSQMDQNAAENYKSVILRCRLNQMLAGCQLSTNMPAASRCLALLQTSTAVSTIFP